MHFECMLGLLDPVRPHVCAFQFCFELRLSVWPNGFLFQCVSIVLRGLVEWRPPFAEGVKQLSLEIPIAL